jgi:hypothetical protein
MGLLLAAAGVTIGPPGWAGVWEPVGALSQARDGASATLLADGTVLVAGGEGPSRSDPFSILRSAERFDPKTNRFEPTGAMGFPRILHGAVGLPDGRVLILGGLGAGGALAGVEVYDPATGAFAPHGRLTGARIAATATLLPDGRVLVAGGASAPGGRLLATAELFDSATGTSSPTGSMAGPRAGHAAVGLRDGRVAIVGGTADRKDPGIRGVEIYDPISGTFSTQGDLVERRTDQTTTLLPDGRILIAGGYQAVPGAAVKTLRTVEIYDPRTGQSQPIASLARPRYWHAAIALGDVVLLLGGSLAVGDGPATESAEWVDPTSGQVSAAEPMSVPRGRPGAVLLQGGRVLVFGGFPAWGTAPTTHAEIFTP